MNLQNCGLVISAVSLDNFAAGVFIKGNNMGGLVSDCVVVDGNLNVFNVNGCKYFFVYVKKF